MVKIAAKRARGTFANTPAKNMTLTDIPSQAQILLCLQPNKLHPYTVLSMYTVHAAPLTLMHKEGAKSNPQKKIQGDLSALQHGSTAML
mmetsp:Transcript_92996/g.156144  ORF Transcript_92996/g.156144 Transcript_92996/m.156144 type:complete len:89 (-) Transcript_92996:45-311(-)